MTNLKPWVLISVCIPFGIILGICISELARQDHSSVGNTISNASGLLTKTPTQGNLSAGSPTSSGRAMEADIPQRPTLDSAQYIKDKLERTHVLEDLGASLARKNLQEAFETLDRAGIKEDAEALTHGIFHVLGQSDRKFALSQMIFCKQSYNRKSAFEELAKTWGLEDNPFAEFDKNRSSASLGALLLETNPPQTDVALAWANQLGGTEHKPELLGKIAQKLVETSPTHAFELGNQLQGDEYVAFLNSVTEKWAEIDPKAALAWSMQITDPTLRANLQQTLAENLAPSNIDKALAILQTAPQGSFRDSLVVSVAGKLAYQNTEAAFRWAAGLSNPTEKAQAQEIIQNTAPVGIGASLKISNGLPMVAGLVENAPAALSRQLKEGDRIIAVDTTGNGKFISTQGKELDQVTRMIRGRAGTAVRLQVSSINADGFDPVRTVWLSRAQVKFVPEK